MSKKVFLRYSSLDSMRSVRSFVKNKRGGLEISVNSIVILIFAITILSLGLVFINKVFKKTTGTFTDIQDQVKNDLINKLRGSTDRLAFDNEEVRIPPGQTKEMYFAIRNDLDEDVSFTILGNGGLEENSGKWSGGGSIISCYSTTATDDYKVSVQPKFKTSPSVFVKKGDTQVRKMLVTIPSSTPKGVYYCAMVIADPNQENEEYARKDFTITVEKEI